ncbi:MAG: hypothetical protein H6733_09515 [Alphaproteobacteria bacterium]|nr:hypothetical protein [Alphaproteobacteria bacterium]
MPRQLTLALVLVAACAERPGNEDRDGIDDTSVTDTDGAGSVCGPVDAEASLDEGGFLNTLASSDDLSLLSPETGEVKFLLPVALDPAPAGLDAPCFFQDMTRFSFHLDFLRTRPGWEDLTWDGYVDLSLDPSTRVALSGELSVWPFTPHPRGGQGVVAFTLASEAGPLSAFTLDDLVGAAARLRQCAPWLANALVFVPTDAATASLVALVPQTLSDRGVDVLSLDALGVGLGSRAYVSGETYGYVRVLAEDDDDDDHEDEDDEEDDDRHDDARASGDRGRRGATASGTTALDDLGPDDVVIASHAPPELSIVAGLLTDAVQSAHSHLNLRLAEKGTPSATVPDIVDTVRDAGLVGTLVHVVVTDHRVAVEPATLEDARTFWDQHRPRPDVPVADLTRRDVAPFDTLGRDDAGAYGSKAAWLGELQRAVDAPHRAEGFAIPFARYQEHFEASGAAARARQLARDAATLTPEALADALDDIRDRIRDYPLDPELVAEIRAAATDLLGDAAATTRLRFRSSSNAEDLPTWSAAGLYRSASGCFGDDDDDDGDGPSRCRSDAELDVLDTRLDAAEAAYAQAPSVWLDDWIDELRSDRDEERYVAVAVRKVWASLWGDRAYAERRYYGVDDADVKMGIAVNPSFALEQVDAVVEMGFDAPHGWGVRVVSLADGYSVVSPEDPTIDPEVITFAYDVDCPTPWSVRVQSRYAGDPDARLWSDDDLGDLATILGQLRTRLEPDHWPVEIELKRTVDGELVIKQVRSVPASP